MSKISEVNWRGRTGYPESMIDPSDVVFHASGSVMFWMNNRLEYVAAPGHWSEMTFVYEKEEK